MASRRVALACAFVASVAGAGGATKRTAITVWAAAPAATGGAGYGGFAAPTGAMIVEHREVDVSAAGELKIAGIATTIDPASVVLKSLSDPSGFAIVQQRVIPGATTPTEILARHVGEPVSVVTTKGDVTGVLRSVDDQTIVIEIGSGDQRRVAVMRRDGYVQDVRLTTGAGPDKPSLAWRLATKKPGKHQVELSYRADGMSWTADYLAVLDEAGKTVDFSAWANVKNAAGATFDDAELTLIGAARPPAAPLRFAIAKPVRLGQGEIVQVELIPPRVSAPARTVVVFETMPDRAGEPQAAPITDCNQTGAATTTTARSEVALEVVVPTTTALPDGRVRAFRRVGGRLEVVNEDQLRSLPGLARVRLVPDNQITGERRQVAGTCMPDERVRTLRERIEVKLENKGKQAVDVVVREAMWRWSAWRTEADDGKGRRAGPQMQEYRVHLAANAKQTVGYTAVYTW